MYSFITEIIWFGLVFFTPKFKMSIKIIIENHKKVLKVFFIFQRNLIDNDLETIKPLCNKKYRKN